jgi:hypothetical protein
MVPSETLRGAEVPSPQPRRVRRGLILGLAGVAAVVAGLGGWAAFRGVEPTAAPSPLAGVTPRPSAASALLAAPSGPSQPTASPDAAAVVDAAASPVEVAAVEATEDDGTERRRGRHRRSRRSRREPESTASAAPGRIHAD